MDQPTGNELRSPYDGSKSQQPASEQCREGGPRRQHQRPDMSIKRIDGMKEQEQSRKQRARGLAHDSHIVSQPPKFVLRTAS